MDLHDYSDKNLQELTDLVADRISEDIMDEVNRKQAAIDKEN